jgi:hypothetical protein
MCAHLHAGKRERCRAGSPACRLRATDLTPGAGGLSTKAARCPLSAGASPTAPSPHRKTSQFGTSHFMKLAYRPQAARQAGRPAGRLSSVPACGIPMSGGATIPDFTATSGASRPRPLARRGKARRWTISASAKNEQPPGPCLPALLHACSRASGSAGIPGLPLAEGAHAVRRSPCGHDGRGCLGTHWFHCVVEVGVPARKLASPASTRERSNQPRGERPVEPDAVRMACPCSTEAGSSKTFSRCR